MKLKTIGYPGVCKACKEKLVKGVDKIIYIEYAMTPIVICANCVDKMHDLVHGQWSDK